MDRANLASRLRGIIDTAIDGIITISSKGIVETINQAAADQFEYEASEVVGNNIKMLMPEPYHSQHDGYLDRYNKTKEARIIGLGREVTGKTKNGKLFPFRLAVSEVILNDRVIFTGIIHDLTEIKDANQKLRNLNEALEQKVQQRTEELKQSVEDLQRTNEILKQQEIELNAALVKEKELSELKSRFVSMASHEFRTPLSTIMSSASLIARYPREDQHDKREKHVNRIKSAVVNLTGILNDFLSLSKIEEGKVEVKLATVNIRSLYLLIIDEVEGLLKKGQKIDYQQEYSITTIETDERILKNILFNMLSNAIKYSPKRSTIYCTVVVEEKEIIFNIRDQGIGIPEKDQKYLFTRFFRASNVENIQGTGLGLSIVKRYAEMIGGKVGFKSEFEKGSDFFIRFPYEELSISR